MIPYQKNPEMVLVQQNHLNHHASFYYHISKIPMQQILEQFSNQWIEKS